MPRAVTRRPCRWITFRKGIGFGAGQRRILLFGPFLFNLGTKAIPCRYGDVSSLAKFFPAISGRVMRRRARAFFLGIAIQAEGGAETKAKGTNAGRFQKKKQ